MKFPESKTTRRKSRLSGKHVLLTAARRPGFAAPLQGVVRVHPPLPLCDLRWKKGPSLQEEHSRMRFFVTKLDAAWDNKSSVFFTVVHFHGGSLAYLFLGKVHLFCRSGHLSSLSHTLRVKLEAPLQLYLYTSFEPEARRRKEHFSLNSQSVSPTGVHFAKGNNNWHTSLALRLLLQDIVFKFSYSRVKLITLRIVQIFSSLRME